MRATSKFSGARPRPRRWPRLAGRVAVLAAVVLPAALVAAGPAGASPSAVSRATVSPADAAPTAPSTAPPPVTILKQGAVARDGDIFISPFGDTASYANGPEILSPQGKVIWFKPVPAGQEAADFRTQIYRGRHVLTWWQGTGLGGLASGTDYIYNDQFQQIATVSAGNGYSADGHEFLITPWNTALILAYTARHPRHTMAGVPDPAQRPSSGGRPAGPCQPATGASASC